MILGFLLFIMRNASSGPGRTSSETGQTNKTESDIVIADPPSEDALTDENIPEMPTDDIGDVQEGNGAESQEFPPVETGIGEMPPEEQQSAETPFTEPDTAEGAWMDKLADRPDLHGSYGVAENLTSAAAFEEPGVSSELSIPAGTILSVDRVVEWNEQLWGSTSFCGRRIWMQMADLALLSRYDFQANGDIEYYLVRMNLRRGTDARKEADEAGAFVENLSAGTELTFLTWQDGWIKAVFHTTRIGWIHGEDTVGYTSKLPYVYTGSAAKYLHEKADSNSAKIGYFQAGTTVYFEDFFYGWAQVEVENTRGWVRMDGFVPVHEDTSVGSEGSLILVETEPPTESPKETQPAAPETQPAVPETQPVVPAQTETEVPGDTTLYKDGTKVADTDYIWPEAHNRILSDAEIDTLTIKGICYLKNEMYAVHGYKFKTPELQTFFRKRAWYPPAGEKWKSMQDAEKAMNASEKENMNALSVKELALTGGKGYQMDGMP